MGLIKPRLVQQSFHICLQSFESLVAKDYDLTTDLRLLADLDGPGRLVGIILLQYRVIRTS